MPKFLLVPDLELLCESMLLGLERYDFWKLLRLFLTTEGFDLTRLSKSSE